MCPSPVKPALVIASMLIGQVSPWVLSRPCSKGKNQAMGSASPWTVNVTLLLAPVTRRVHNLSAGLDGETAVISSCFSFINVSGVPLCGMPSLELSCHRQAWREHFGLSHKCQSAGCIKQPSLKFWPRPSPPHNEEGLEHCHFTVWTSLDIDCLHNTAERA